jgi:hypothetical protein
MYLTAEKQRQVENIIRRYRSASKQDYAKRYLYWYTHDQETKPEPNRGELSYMGAQAVRMDVGAILD